MLLMTTADILVFSVINFIPAIILVHILPSFARSTAIVKSAILFFVSGGIIGAAIHLLLDALFPIDENNFNAFSYGAIIILPGIFALSGLAGGVVFGGLQYLKENRRPW